MGETIVYCTLRKERRIGFSKEQMCLFPKAEKSITLTFETDIGDIEVSYNPLYTEFGPKGVHKWLDWLEKSHPELKQGGDGDKVILRVIKSRLGTRYILELPKW